MATENDRLVSTGTWGRGDLESLAASKERLEELVEDVVLSEYPQGSVLHDRPNLHKRAVELLLDVILYLHERTTNAVR